MEKITKLLFDRRHDLDRKRTRALATQQWNKVIELEARLDEIELLRKTIIDLIKHESSPTNPAP